MIPLKVLGDRVLIRPDLVSNAPEQTESGVILARSMAAAVTGEDATTSLCRGTVVAVGTPRHPLKDVAEDTAVRLRRTAFTPGFVSGAGTICQDLMVDAARTLEDIVRKQPAVAIGDDVLFSHDAGQDVTLDGETYVLMREAELLAVIEPEKDVAA